MKAMLRVMKYCIDTKGRGMFLNPKRAIDGEEMELEVSGCSDSDFAKDETRRSVTGFATFLEGAPVTHKSGLQKCVLLSVTEAEAMAGVHCVQDMLFIWEVITSMGLKVKLPMVIWCDNKGAVDLANNWSANGRTRHVSTKLNFLRDLKEEGVVQMKWISGEMNCSDLFTKNLGRTAFERHTRAFCGSDSHYK